MRRFNVHFKKPGAKNPEKNRIVEAMDAQSAAYVARVELGVSEQFAVGAVQDLGEVAAPQAKNAPMPQSATGPIVLEGTPTVPSPGDAITDVATDPTLAELGIDGEAADLLTAAKLTSLLKIEAYGDLTRVKGIGPKTAGDIRAAIDLYREG